MADTQFTGKQIRDRSLEGSDLKDSFIIQPATDVVALKVKPKASGVANSLELYNAAGVVQLKVNKDGYLLLKRIVSAPGSNEDIYISPDGTGRIMLVGGDLEVGTSSNVRHIIFQNSASIKGTGTQTIGLGTSGDTINQAVAGVTHQLHERFKYDILNFYVKSPIAGDYILGKDSMGYAPAYAIHLKRLVVCYNRTTAAPNLVVIVYKTTEVVGNIVFEISDAVAASGWNRISDTTINNSGMDAISISDSVFIKIVTATNIDQLTITLEYIVDNGY